MTENLNKRPRKSILKSSSSFDKPQQYPLQSQASAVEHTTTTGKCAKFDEMNIIETLHPADKDYGHMKIEEPKTPFHYLEDDIECLELDAEVLKERITSRLNSPPRATLSLDSDSDEEEAEEDPEEKKVFECKRKAHYNEYYAVKLARKLIEEEDEDDEEKEEKKFIPTEEIEIMEEA